MHILPLSATEIEARLRKLPEHVADQTYQPESEHPQSGKAVAEALSNVLKEEDGVVATEASICTEGAIECSSIGLHGGDIDFVGAIRFSNDAKMAVNDFDRFLFQTGIGEPIKLGNLAEGVFDTDAVTVKQLKDVQNSVVAVQIVTWEADD